MTQKTELLDPVTVLTELALRVLPTGKLRTAIGEWYWDRSFKKFGKMYDKQKKKERHHG